MPTMCELLGTGRLGEIALGMTKERAFEILGTPDDESVRSRPLILRYGAIELTFARTDDTKRDVLTMISLYFQETSQRIPEALRPTDWLPTSATTLSEFRAQVSASGIALHSSINGENEYLVTPAGANAVFSEGKLHSIHFTRRTAPARKQLSLSLPAETFERLQERAHRRRIPVRNYIEQLVIHGSEGENC